MSRRNNAAARCGRCRMHLSICVCALIPTIATRTRLLLLIHRIEERKTTNTGQLAALCLTNSEIVRRGDRTDSEPPLTLDPASQPLLVFPHDDAKPLSTFASLDRPITLIVPDGTWRQAFKARKRVPQLDTVPCVTLPLGDASTYRLRTELHPGGLSTLEAIARAMGILEGPEVEGAILRVFRIMVDRTLWSRGVLADAEVTGGVPPGAKRHAPLSGDRLAAEEP